MLRRWVYSGEGGGGGKCGAGMACQMTYRIPKVSFIMGYDGRGTKGPGCSKSEMR